MGIKRKYLFVFISENEKYFGNVCVFFSDHSSYALQYQVPNEK